MITLLRIVFLSFLSLSSMCLYANLTTEPQKTSDQIKWHPWAEGTFDLAQQENKPIFLLLTYPYSRQSFIIKTKLLQDSKIRNYLNQHYICIDLDAETHSLLRLFYTDLFEKITLKKAQNCCLFLTSDKYPFYGTTFDDIFDPHFEINFHSLIKRLRLNWFTSSEQIIEDTKKLVKVLSIANTSAFGTKTESTSWNNTRLQTIETLFQKTMYPRHQLFQKLSFLPFVCIQFLLKMNEHNKNPKSLQLASDLLHTIADGPLYDHLSGGVHHYSSHPFWGIPHFEKTLSDQALFIQTCLKLYEKTHQLYYKKKLKDTFKYVQNTLMENTFIFFSSQNSQTPINKKQILQQHNTSYLWKESTIDTILNPWERKIFKDYYDIHPYGNIKYHFDPYLAQYNVLRKRYPLLPIANKYSRTEKQIQSILKKTNYKLLEYQKNSFSTPKVHKTFLIEDNGFMLGVMAQCGRILKEKDWTRFAEETARFLIDNTLNSNGTLHYPTNQMPSPQITLSDYVFFVYGLIELYISTKNQLYLEKALLINKTMFSQFYIPQGILSYSSKESSPPLFPYVTIKDAGKCSAISMALHNQLFLRKLNPDKNTPDLKKIKTMLPFFEKHIETHFSIEFAGLFLFLTDYVAEHIIPPKIQHTPPLSTEESLSNELSISF